LIGREGYAARWNKPVDRECSMRAAYRLDGVCYCIRHAEKKALEFLKSQQETL
jgi:hypothetical protein